MTKENENKIEPRIFLNSYKKDDVLRFFDGKENCKYCPFKMTFKGKIEFDQGDYHRFYCLFGYTFADPASLALVMNIDPYMAQKYLKLIIEADKIIRLGIEPSFVYPDIVRVHPQTRPDKTLLAINVIRIKELDNCHIDRWKRNEIGLSKKLVDHYNNFLERHGLPVTRYLEGSRLQ